MKFKEIEFKYAADNVSLVQFLAFCEDRKGLKQKFIASGYDHFYDKKDEPDSFYRLRVGEDFTQLTFKRRTSTLNNVVRTEHNVSLSSNTSEDQIRALVGEQGYSYNTSIFKTCFVFCFEEHVFSYYVVFNKDLRETGRFIEIEASEEHPWSNEGEATSYIAMTEKLLRPLGISPQNRIKRSLFELNRK